jgi:hypothetical protein
LLNRSTLSEQFIATAISSGLGKLPNIPPVYLAKLFSRSSQRVASVFSKAIHNGVTPHPSFEFGLIPLDIKIFARA